MNREYSHRVPVSLCLGRRVFPYRFPENLNQNGHTVDIMLPTILHVGHQLGKSHDSSSESRTGYQQKKAEDQFSRFFPFIAFRCIRSSCGREGFARARSLAVASFRSIFRRGSGTNPIRPRKSRSRPTRGRQLAGFSARGLPSASTCETSDAGTRSVAVVLAGISTDHDRPPPVRFQWLPIVPYIDS